MRVMKKCSIILILALTLMGVAYARWSHEVDVDSTLATGTLRVEVISKEEDIIVVNRHSEGDKPVYSELSAKVTSDRQEVIIVGDNYYPGIENKIRFELQNTGNIPVDLVVNQYDVALPESLKMKLSKKSGVYVDGKWSRQAFEDERIFRGVKGTHFGRILKKMQVSELYPQEVLVIDLGLEFEEDLENAKHDGYLEEGKGLDDLAPYSMTFKFDVYQFNVDQQMNN